MESLIDSFLTWKIAVVLTWLGLFFLAERLNPAAEMPAAIAGDGWGPRLHRWARNLGLWAMNAGLSPLIVVPVSIMAAQSGLDWRPAWWDGWLGLAVDILILDFWIYWWHRANHEVQLLWRFHEVHHLDRFLDTTSAVRFHFGEVLLSAGVRAVVIVVLAIPVTSVFVFESLVLLAAIFHHSNLRLPAWLERGLSKVVITPGIHWVHHHAIRADTDSNYGTIFSFWDPLFRSRSRTRRWATMPIGVQGRRERPIVQLLLRPFRLRRAES